MHITTGLSDCSPPSTGSMKRGITEIEVVASAKSPNKNKPNKRQRVGHSNSIVPGLLTMQPHDEIMQELKGKYSIATTSVVSSSKISKKVAQVLSHLGHVDLFSQSSIPGVMMLHARANDANKMVTVMEVAKRRMNEAGQPWYQYNRVYEVADDRDSRANTTGRGADLTFIEDTVMAGQDADEDDEEEAFEPAETAFERATQKKPAEPSKVTYMSIFLARVPIPELQSKTYITLQTNGKTSADGPGNERRIKLGN